MSHGLYVMPEHIDICAFLHKPGEFSRRSGLAPLAESLGARCIYYNFAWERVGEQSWRLGHTLRRMGIRYYGSAWNALVPIWSEWKLSREYRREPARVAHFLWGEFASPRRARPFRSRDGLVVGTFHASARRQPSVMTTRFRLDVFDAVTTMSASQEPFFLERGVPPDRLATILHGVDVEYFVPPICRMERDGPLRLLLVGSTERDHEFAAAVMNRLPDGIASLSICTSREQQIHYRNAKHVNVLPFLAEAAFLSEYQQADLLFMPMLDCTANNAVLESMACGTPVMVNRVGGIPEYVNPSCNVVMDEKRVDAWVEKLIELSRSRDALEGQRSAVRTWAEGFAWPLVARHYLDLFERLCK